MRREALQFTNLEELHGFINEHIAQAPQWGQGNAKTIEHLWREIEERDTVLIRDGQQPLRLTWPVFINVLYSHNAVAYLLYEEKQVLRDGRERVRSLPGSIGEKGKLNEKPIKTARRAISEELDTIPLSLEGAKLVFDRRWEERESARSYPGLLTLSKNTIFRLHIQPDQGAPSRFQKNEKGDTLFFNWRQDTTAVQKKTGIILF